MIFLIDTHAFIWCINDSDQLSEMAKILIESDTDLWISSASLWEMAIKINIQKLTLPQPFEDFITEQLTVNEIEVLIPSIQHFAAIIQLPLHHRDPFDPLIIAQAITKGVSIISIDAAFDAYGVERIW